MNLFEGSGYPNISTPAGLAGPFLREQIYHTEGATVGYGCVKHLKSGTSWPGYTSSILYPK